MPVSLLPLPTALDAVRRRARADAGNPADSVREPHAAVSGVAGEALVAAVAVQRDRHVFARELGEVEARDRRAVGERLAVMPDELREQLDRVGLDVQLVVIGAEARRDFPRVRGLVEGGDVEADRERLDRLG